MISHRFSQPFFVSRKMLILPAILFLLIFLVVPVVQLLAMGFQSSDGAWSLAQFERLFSSGVYMKVMGITFRIAWWSTVFSLFLAYPVAYLMAISGERMRNSLTFWILFPFWTSFLVRTFAWIIILGRTGPVNELASSLGLVEEPMALMFNFTGVMIGMVHAIVPLCVMTMVSVMLSIDRNLTPAAMTLGARRPGAFLLIFFPLSLPGVAAAGLLAFVTALGFFITPALLGGRRETTISQVVIDEIQQLLNWPFAAAIAIILLTATAVAFLIYERFAGLGALGGAAAASMEKSGKQGAGSGRLSRMALDRLATSLDGLGRLFDRILPDRKKERGHVTLTAAVILVIAFLALPAFIMVPISLTEGTIVDWPPHGFSLQWYEAFFSSPQWISATFRSLVVAALTAVFSLALGVPAAIAIARGGMPGASAILGLILLPLLVPRIVIAVALFYLFANIGMIGTTLGLVIGHSVLALPYVVITLTAVLKGYDGRFDQAAMSLGANRLTTFRLVTLPLIRPGILSAALFAFITSLDELTIALFVTGGLTTTLPKQMWDEAILKVTPVVGAASTLLLVFVLLIVVLSEWLKRRAQL